jgi:predicted  nucleic acid-binding Zn-ribbon protein
MKNYSQLLPNSLPALAGSIVGSGIIYFSGGNLWQASVGFISTITGGYFSLTLVGKEIDELKQRELLTGEIESLKAEKNDLDQRVTNIKKDNDNLPELEKRQRESVALKTEINELQGTLSFLKQQQIQERESHKNLLEKVSGLKAKLDYLLQQQELLTAKIESLNSEKNDLDQRVTNIKKDNYNLPELEKRQRESVALKTEINELQGTLSVLKQQIQEKERQKSLLQEVSGQYFHKQGELKELNEKIQELTQKASDLEIFKTTYDSLKHEYSDLENSKQHLNSEIPRLEAKKDRILAEIQSIEIKAQEVDLLRREIENLEADIRIKNNKLASLERKLKQLNSEILLLKDEIARKETEIKRQEAILKELHEKIRLAKEEIEEIENSVKYAFQALQIPVKVTATNVKNFVDESQFLKEFKDYLTAKGLSFSERVINAFHTSLKVQDISALVILAGISGTGKSELPQAYAEFIGAPLVMLPVQPRWDSPQDLQGFYNYIEKKYKPTELMRYLYQHQRQQNLKNRIVLVLLDEMNLARVEYYFSDFLSKLESRRNIDTFLEIEAGSLKLDDEEKRVKIPEQFLFVGTMNEDETTQSLSDKVLDRANVLTFGKPSQLKLHGSKQRVFLSQEYLSWQTFTSWFQQPEEGSFLVEEVKDYVDRANKIMEALGRPFAHRVYQAIAKYTVNYPGALQNETIGKQAIADQFGQKLLPKLRGLMVEDSNVKPQLDRLKNLIAELGDESLKQAFQVACQGQYGQFQWKGMIYS